MSSSLEESSKYFLTSFQGLGYISLKTNTISDVNFNCFFKKEKKME